MEYGKRTILRDGTIELDDFEVLLWKVPRLESIVREMKAVLGLPVSESAQTLRVVRPWNRFLTLMLFVAVWATVLLIRHAMNIGSPLWWTAVLVAAAIAVGLWRWLGGGIVIVQDGRVRQEGGTSVSVPIADVRCFRARRAEGLLTAARLVAETKGGEVVFDRMIAAPWQVQELEEAARQLNARLGQGT
ncbi:hypothetical protein [Nocardioides sp. AE5]|uniref:hypothetical protein n=1 Tax=Nocardioides sp. AE5 TaxID=2962573 RepID=UPI0028813925|nr:hypothetical protein [Nocardioides sp. AE5]MDT0201594.1 hypothetical protein [Nocardioides sp. AE5]